MPNHRASATAADAGADRTLLEFYHEHYARNASKPAVSCVLPNGWSATLTYEEVDRASDNVAAWLREELNLTPGATVAVQAPNCLAFPVISKGIVKAGLIPTGVNPLYTARETANQLAAADAKALFVLDALAGELEQVLSVTGPITVITISVGDLFPRLRRRLINFMLRRVKKIVPSIPVSHTPLPQVFKVGATHAARVGREGVRRYTAHVRASDVVGYSFTGGTTGRSKGVVQTHAGLLASVDQMIEHLGTPWRDEEMRTLLVLPLYHVFGIGMMLQSAAQSGHVILIPNPRPLTNLRAAMEKFRPTFLPGVPTLFLNLLREDWFRAAAPGDLKLCLSGAAPLSRETQAQWQELTGMPIHEIYGMTESGAVTCTPLDGGDYTGTIGRPMPNIEARVVDACGSDAADGEPGELILRGPQIMRGYLNQPEETEQVLKDGWLYTGDVVIRSPEGILRIVDRAKDMVIVSGFNVYPSEVEAVVMRHPGVAECAAIGTADPSTGERVKLFVVAGDNPPTDDDILRHCREFLTGYKVPKEVVFVSELPKSPIGKVLRRELRSLATRL
jgi:long-chain acyl-CoA synthetase